MNLFYCINQQRGKKVTSFHKLQCLRRVGVTQINQIQRGAMNQKSLRNTVLETHKYMSIIVPTKTCQCTGCNKVSKDTTWYMPVIGTTKMLLYICP
jgi:hypothetical protein